MASTTENKGSMPTNAKNELGGWGDVVPKQVTHADSVSAAQNVKYWNDLYKAGGIQNGDETKKKSFRLWIYVTGAINGTSRVGEYGGIDKLADGTIVEAAIIPRVLGKNIRKFYRTNMEESYIALKTSQALVAYPRFLAKAATFGASPEEAFAIADWLAECPLFTPAEKSIHDKAFVINLSKSRRTRDGMSLEAVEDVQRSQIVAANGYLPNDSVRNDRVEF